MAANQIDNIYTSYLTKTATSGNVFGGDAGVKSISYDGEELLFSENDGDIISINVGEISDSVLDSLNEKFGLVISVAENKNPIDVNGTDKSDKTDETKKASKAEDTKAANAAKQAEIKDKEAKISNLSSRSDNIKSVVEQLSKEIETELKDAVNKQAKATEDEQKRIQDAVQKEIEQYKADREAGKDVPMGILSARIESAMSDAGFNSEMQQLISGLVLTNSKMKQMESLLGELNTVTDNINDLDAEIEQLTSEIKDTEPVEGEGKHGRHDPIGFSTGDVKYEFVVDRDNSGDLTDVSEFLGAENNFDEMSALDGDNSGNVDKAELNAAGVKVLVTDTTTGEQTLKSIEEAFGENELCIDTANYNDLADQNVLDENGQQVLGNFNVTLGDETLTGYSTLDTDEYLAANYKFSGTNPLEATGSTGKYDATTEANENFFETYSQKLQEYETQFDQIMETYNLNESLIASIKELGKITGQQEAANIISEVDKEEAEEETTTSETTETTEAADDSEETTAEATEEDEEDKDKEEDK